MECGWYCRTVAAVARECCEVVVVVVAAAAASVVRVPGCAAERASRPRLLDCAGEEDLARHGWIGRAYWIGALLLHYLFIVRCLALPILSVCVCTQEQEVRSVRGKESISIADFFQPNRGVDFYFEFLPVKLTRRFLLPIISSRQIEESVDRSILLPRGKYGGTFVGIELGDFLPSPSQFIALNSGFNRARLRNNYVHGRKVSR